MCNEVLSLALLVIGFACFIPVAFWLGIQVGRERERDTQRFNHLPRYYGKSN